MPMTVLVKTKGFQELEVYFQETKNRSNDLNPPLKKSVNIMFRSIDSNFRQSGRPIPWKPLALSTIKQKFKQRYSIMPLIRTGQLRRSITGFVDKNKMRMGTSVPYAPYHQFGTRRIPKRTFLVFQDKDVQQINRLVAEHIIGRKVSG